MRKTFKITDEEWEEILKINREGSDPVLYLSGGQTLGRSKGEKINDFWKKKAGKDCFDMSTIEPITQRSFTAVVVSDTKSENIF